jgi:hypothetical protein
MIIQDGNTPLVLTMNDIDVLEGDSGTSEATVTVSLSAQTGRTITADYNTAGGTAFGGVDFIQSSGSVTFAPGVATQNIVVTIVGDTIGESNETFRVLLSNPINASVGNFSTVRILDNDRPTITPVFGITRQRGSPGSNSIIANVTDLHQAPDTLVVTVNGGPSAVVAGVKVSDISISAGGEVTADIAAACSSFNAGFTLTVTNSFSATATASLVVNVTINPMPTIGDYPNAAVLPEGNITVVPTVPPADNITVSGITAVVQPASFTGSLSVNTSTGAVTITGANPPGTYTVTVRVTDNCNASATRLFELTVDPCLATLNASHRSFAANGGSDSFSIMIDSNCSWTAVTSDPAWITIISGANGTGNGTVTYNVDSNPFANHPRTGQIIAAGQTFTIYQGVPFNDVPPGHPFYDEIGKLSARGVTLGCGNGIFCPEDFVTREQMAAFIVRALGEFNPPTPGEQRFQDVMSDNPFYSFIDRLAALQITLGCSVSPPLYCPSNTVTREQMAAFLIRALGEFNPPLPSSQRFNDVPPSNTFYNFIDRLAALGITLGCSSDPPLYCPANTVTRGQMAAFLVRAFDL